MQTRSVSTAVLWQSLARKIRMQAVASKKIYRSLKIWKTANTRTDPWYCVPRSIWHHRISIWEIRFSTVWHICIITTPVISGAFILCMISHIRSRMRSRASHILSAHWNLKTTDHSMTGSFVRSVLHIRQDRSNLPRCIWPMSLPASVTSSVW